MTEKRSIFEEVESDKPVDQGSLGSEVSFSSSRSKRAIKMWLSILFVFVSGMIVVGGLTRLTDSGLSITEWKPILGALPPLSLEMWQLEFDKYKMIPEYQIQNKSMSLEDFKIIYWWEWGHRQLGRIVGVIWLVGFIWLYFSKKLDKLWISRAGILGVLGGLQGFIGWWMVSSGLTGRMVDVASYRLAIHLGLAFLIISLITWYILQTNKDDKEKLRSRREREGQLLLSVNILLSLVFAQILLGALVAGIDAGRGYTDWPLMNGEVFPSESFAYSPFFINFTENPALVQFNHRILGYLTMIYAFYVWWKCRSSTFTRTSRLANLVLGIIFLQMLMGIITILYAAPMGWALLHQFGAVLIIVSVQCLRSQIYFPVRQLVTS